MYMNEMNDYDRANCGCGCNNFNPMMEQPPMMQSPYMCEQGALDPMMTAPMMPQQDACQLENIYPEIYKMVFPMVNRACDNLKYMGVTNNIITVNIIDEMVENIYMNVNTDEDRSTEEEDERGEDTARVSDRNLMRDLIRILLIRELIRRGFRTYRPFGGFGGYGMGYRPY